MKIPFSKVHTYANDYIVVDMASNEFEKGTDESSVALKMCQRRFCVGGDGVAFLYPSDKADGEIRLYNSDGTRSKMSQNTVGCVARMLYDRTKKQSFTFICEGDTVDVSLFKGISNYEMFEIYLKKPDYDIPMCKLPKEKGIKVGQIRTHCDVFPYFCVGIGEMHAVLFDCDEYNIKEVALKIQTGKFLKGNLNTAFVKTVTPNKIRTRFYERANGYVMSSISGACACASVAQKKDFCAKNGYVTVETEGGRAHFRTDTCGDMYLYCESEKIFDACYEYCEESI